MHIIVLESGSKWVPASDAILVKVTKEQFRQLEQGKQPADLDLYGEPVTDVIRRSKAVKLVKRFVKAVKEVL